MFLLINKPPGWTSHDVVAYIRKQISEQTKKVDLPAVARLARCSFSEGGRAKVGHAGTLDPFATGLLIVGIGREATKKLDEFKNLPKTYIATLKLGYVSNTFDKTGTITNYQLSIINKFSILQFLKKAQNKNLKLEKINSTLNKFIGKIKQTPPMFSAKKINGQKLYELARKGIMVPRKKINIEIFNIKILDYLYPLLKIEVDCSSGTYIRTLANDIGKKLGMGAYCEELKRTAIGEYKLENASLLQDLSSQIPSESRPAGTAI